MSVRTTYGNRRVNWALAGIAVLMTLAIATPAAADDQHKGWFAALDFALTQPTSFDQHYADNVDLSGSFPRTSRLVLDTDDDSTFRLRVGYDFGGSLGSLRVSYWGIDSEQSQSGFLAGYTAPAIFGAGYLGNYFNGYYMYVYDADVTAASEIEATTLDVDYVRPVVVGDKTTLSWLAGLRVATFEEELSFIGDDGFSVYLQDRHIDTDAVGFRVGAAADFELSEHCGLETGMAVSFMQADTEGMSSQSFDSFASETRSGSDDNLYGTIWDFDLKFLWTTRRLDYYVGYSVSVWDGLVTNPVPANALGWFPGDPSPGRTRENVGFNSVNAGIVWRFGGGG